MVISWNRVTCGTFFFNWTPNLQSMQLDKIAFVLARDRQDYSPECQVETDSEDPSGSESEQDSDQSDWDWDIEGSMGKMSVEVERPNVCLQRFSFTPSDDYSTFPLCWTVIFSAYPNLKVFII